jgi:hypothetical protein
MLHVIRWHAHSRMRCNMQEYIQFLRKLMILVYLCIFSFIKVGIVITCFVLLFINARNHLLYKLVKFLARWIDANNSGKQMKNSILDSAWLDYNPSYEPLFPLLAVPASHSGSSFIYIILIKKCIIVFFIYIIYVRKKW